MYAYDHDFSDADVRAWLERQQRRYATLGFGLWAAIELDSGAMVGEAGLTMLPCEGQEVLEVGYQLKWKHWHKGSPVRLPAPAGTMPLRRWRGSGICHHPHR